MLLPASSAFIDKCNVEDGWQDISGACYKLFSDVMSSWGDARQQCLRNNGDLYNPASSPYVIDKLVSCRISTTHVWLGVSDVVSRSQQTLCIIYLDWLLYIYILQQSCRLIV